MTVYVPDKNATNILSPEEAFKQQMIIPGGVFSIQQDFDSKYILVPLAFAKELTSSPDGATAVEIILQNKKEEAQVKEKIKQIAGNRFVIKGRAEQHELLYKILKSEKWAVFLILSFIMVIGIFNILGTLTMLVIEKKRDIQILKNLGAPLETVRLIFFNEGLLITLSGVGIGLFLGWVICFLQQTFGLVKLGEADAFLVSAYPVSMQLLDFTFVAATVFFMGAIASFIVAGKLVRKYY
jgi:lipoprotein-releasing system permease protein